MNNVMAFAVSHKQAQKQIDDKEWKINMLSGSLERAVKERTFSNDVSIVLAAFAESVKNYMIDNSQSHDELDNLIVLFEDAFTEAINNG